MYSENNEQNEPILAVPSNKSNEFVKSSAFRIAPYFGLMMASLIGAIFFHDSNFFFMITGMSLCISISFFAIGKTIKNIFSKEPLGESAEIYSIIAFIAIGGLVLGVLGMTERAIWANAENVPSFLISEDFTLNKKTFDVNQYRLLKWNCRDRNSVMELRETDHFVYARCGMWYPSTRLIKADRSVFEAAQNEAMNVPDSAPITLPPFTPE